MERQVALVLVVLCALLRGACTQSCEFDAHADKGLAPLLLASPLRRVDKSDLSSCQAQCCALPGCDAAVLGLPADGLAQCFLISCGGACTLQDDVSGQFKVFTRKGGEHAPNQAPQVVPLMMDAGTRTEDNKNNTSTAACELPPEVGLCKAAFPRFYYDAANQTCSRFIYGGCGSNGNNFETQQECEDFCKGVTRSDEKAKPANKAVRMVPQQIELSKADEREDKPETKEMSEKDFAETCGSKPEVGPCRAMFRRWFYDKASGRCQQFIYGGCKGNSNNYESEERCTSTCAGAKVLPSKKQSSEMSDQLKEQCGAPPDSGPCRASFSMFYFHPESQSCRLFVYGGCKGNKNRYSSEEDCTKTCVLGASSEGHGNERNRWTAAFFLFLALATVSFLLLTALVFVTLRRIRPTLHRPLSVRSDKVGLLPDLDRSSLDSLPLPESPTTDAGASPP